MLKKTLAVAALAAFAANVQADARDHIEIVGSSTVYPFATVVAEKFGKSTKFKTPKIESTGSGGGLKLFCKGVGVKTPDVTNASRRIKSSEQKKCAKNGIKDIVEIKIGYDGIAIANSKKAKQFELTRKDLYLALAKLVPGKDGKLIANPHKTWKDVNKALPATKIEVIGPPPTSGTRDAFAELALGKGAQAFADIKKMKKLKAKDAAEIQKLMAKMGIDKAVWEGIVKKKGKKAKGKDVFKKIAYGVREDGHYIEAGENDNLIIQKLEANADALGVFGYSFLDQNADKVQGSKIEGKEPTFENISSGAYKVSRPLYFYVKKAHAGKIPGIKEYLAEFTSEKTWGDDGYLSDKGLIPMPKEERAKFAATAKNLTPMETLK